MKLNTDTRGVSEVVGAILVFGLLIALLAIFQTQAGPAANEEVEFNHNQEVQGDLAGLIESSSRVMKDGRSESVSVRMGPSYPARLLFFNPQNPQGELSTSDKQAATISNIQSSEADVQQYIIDQGGQFEVGFRTLTFEPNYNEYGNAPTTTFEHGVLYDDFGDEKVFRNTGKVVDGRTISLTTPAGELREQSGGTKSINVRPGSAPPQTVSVTNDPGDQVVITLPTNLDDDKWTELLEDELTPEGHVENFDVDEANSEVTIVLEEDVTYQLEMPRFSVGDSSITAEPQYVAPTGSGIERANPGQSVELSAEVRDEYNNPLPDEDVTFEIPDGQGGTETVEVTSNAEGMATHEFVPEFTGNNDVAVDAESISGPLGQSEIEIQVGGSVAGPVTMQDSSRTTDEVTYELQNEGGIGLEVERIQLQYAAFGQDELPILGSVIGALTGGETVVEGPTEITDVEFMGTTDSGIGAEQGKAPTVVDINQELDSGSSTELTITLNEGVDEDDRLLIGIRVFYSGGYSETYDLMLTG